MQRFVEACATWLASRPEAACRRAALALGAAAMTGGAAATDETPAVMAHLEPALTGVRGPLADALRSAGDEIAWFESRSGEVARHMGGRNAMSQVVGPDSPLVYETVRFGTFLIAPGTCYPRHAHSADELYVVVGGRGRWWIGDSPYRSYGPGEVVHVMPWQKHAIRTDEAPLLTLWAWMGDFDFKNYRMEPDGFDADGQAI